MLSDETQIFQVGYSQDTEYYEYWSKLPETSSWNKFPTEENPLARYKFTSLEVNFSPHSKTINRQTYGLLDWLGDMGGLLDALLVIGAIFMTPFAQFALESKLLSSIFRFRSSTRDPFMLVRP